jgi:hypothetical protein
MLRATLNFKSIRPLNNYSVNTIKYNQIVLNEQEICKEDLQKAKMKHIKLTVYLTTVDYMMMVRS